MTEPYWEPLATLGAVSYAGAWSAGTTYQPGQVVRYQGIDYLAVVPSTGQTPPAATTLVLPSPVVNGQWVKGVGGAAVWSPIAAADVAGLVTADTGWTVPTITNGAHYGAPFGPARYRKLATGVVICDGLLTAGAPGTVAFTFPVGYRPDPNAGTRTLIFNTAWQSSGATLIYETFRLQQSDGALVYGVGLPTGVWISVAGVTFFAT